MHCPTNADADSDQQEISKYKQTNIKIPNIFIWEPLALPNKCTAASDSDQQKRSKYLKKKIIWEPPALPHKHGAAPLAVGLVAICPNILKI